jgi:hypothetical protein
VGKGGKVEGGKRRREGRGWEKGEEGSGLGKVRGRVKAGKRERKG